MSKEADDIRRQVLAAFEHEPRVNLHTDTIEIEFDNGIATLSGEVANIAAKRLTLELTAAIPAVAGIVDRLHTRPAVQMRDGEIADHLADALLQDSSFDNCSMYRTVRDERSMIRDAGPDRYAWTIELRVQEGIVTLDGEVPSLSHKRLAGAIAWWIPGSRDVINGLGVVPDERDTDNEILDALRLILEKDRLIDASQISASCENAVVTLTGLVSSKEQRDIVEFDAWAIFGVHNVVNRVVVVTG